MIWRFYPFWNIKLDHKFFFKIRESTEIKLCFHCSSPHFRESDHVIKPAGDPRQVLPDQHPVKVGGLLTNGKGCM